MKNEEDKIINTQDEMSEVTISKLIIDNCDYELKIEQPIIQTLSFQIQIKPSIFEDLLLKVKNQFSYEDPFKMEQEIINNIELNEKRIVIFPLYCLENKTKIKEFFEKKINIKLQEIKENIKLLQKHVHELYHLNKFAESKLYLLSIDGVVEPLKSALEYYIGTQELWLTTQPVLKLSILLKMEILSLLKSENNTKLSITELPEFIQDELKEQYTYELTGDLVTKGIAKNIKVLTI